MHTEFKVDYKEDNFTSMHIFNINLNISFTATEKKTLIGCSHFYRDSTASTVKQEFNTFPP